MTFLVIFSVILIVGCYLLIRSFAVALRENIKGSIVLTDSVVQLEKPLVIPTGFVQARCDENVLQYVCTAPGCGQAFHGMENRLDLSLSNYKRHIRDLIDMMITHKWQEHPEKQGYL